MTKCSKPRNYSNGCVYKLCCEDPTVTEVYVGSTVAFTRRMCQHKYVCNAKGGRGYKANVYQFIRAHGGWSNWTMIQLEAYAADSKRDLESRERYWLDQFDRTLNMIVPTRTKKEYYRENSDKINERFRERVMCDCGSSVSHVNISRHKKSKKHLAFLSNSE